jgi:CheY-like chemotaxis protein
VSGYEIIKCSNGEEAIQMAVENIPDLILIDIMLQGNDGFEVSKRIKKT